MGFWFLSLQQMLLKVSSLNWYKKNMGVGDVVLELYMLKKQPITCSEKDLFYIFPCIL